MALATQCPYCHTAFRVANDQLKLHAGLVRCGACQQTFNGIEHLLAPARTSPVAPAIPAEPTLALVPAPISPLSAVAPEQAGNAEPAASLASDSTDNTDSPASTDSSDTVADVDSSALLQENLPVAAGSTLEFDLGDDALHEDLPDAARIASAEERAIGQLALQTQATLMHQSDSDWSVSEAQSSASKDLREQMHPVWAEQTSISDFTAGTSTDDAAPEAPQTKVFSETSVSDSLSTDASESASVSASEIESNNESNESTDDDTPDFVMHAEQKQRRGKYAHRLLILCTLILFLSLLAQSAYSLRNPMAAWFPQTKPVLLTACQLLHCQIQLPAQIESISIESNELQTLATDQNVFSLAIQLQNKSSTLQSWPMLELILNDRKDKPVLRRVFTPDDYLPGKNDISKGFIPGSEQAIKLYFELSGVKAAGYHVGVFYP